MMAAKEQGDDGLLWTLPAETELTGSDYIDTGIKLFDTNKDFTVEAWATTGSSQASTQATLLHCCKETNPYPGLSCALSNANLRIAVTSKNPNHLLVTFSANTLYKVLVAYNSTSRTFSARINNSIKHDVACNVTASTFQNTLLIGAYVNTALTTYGRYFIGTIHRANVWNYAFTNEELNSWF